MNARRALTMSTAIRVALLALCFVLGAIWVADGLTGPTAASTGADAAKSFRGDVIIMRCATDDARFAVTAFTGSTQAPGKKSELCAEELSLLFREGFAIRDVGHSDVDKKYVVLTLTR
jgi:hypothetical protein